ncbi:MAG: Fe-S cluster assembly protein SufB [Mycoplasmatales bacterium]
MNKEQEEYKFGFHDKRDNVFSTGKGISKEIVRQISEYKQEPKWMLEKRLKAFEIFESKPIPKWGPNLFDLDFEDIVYFTKASENVEKSWEDVSDDIKDTFKKLGVIDAEAEALAGVSNQYDSEVVYESMLEEVREKGIIFVDTDTALKKYPDLFRKYFEKIVPATDNKFSALNSAVWSGGTFIYIPENTILEKPLQAYFRMNSQDIGQFERTIIVVGENSSVHYLEGCTAPIFGTESLHAAVVEIFVEKNARCRYSTVQNWSSDVLNLVTKRAIVEENGLMEWVDGNIGSTVTMKYPACILKGDYSKGKMISVAIAGEGKDMDTGAKMIHLGKNTRSDIVSKSISHSGGNTTYRGLVDHKKTASNAISNIECDTIIVDDISTSDTVPYNLTQNATSKITHEATVSKVDSQKLFYLMSRGLSEQEATQVLILGFINEFVEELPTEYSVELNRLIELDMSDSIG